jgi:hypothetical protein
LSLIHRNKIFKIPDKLDEMDKSIRKAANYKKHIAKYKDIRYDDFNYAKGGGLMSSIR